MSAKRYSTEIIDSSPLRRYTKENERESSNLHRNNFLLTIGLYSLLIWNSN